MVFTPGVMHGSLKIHKPVVSFRPIIDNSVKIGSNVESYILKVLNNIFLDINLFHVKNSYEVVSILKEESGSDLLLPKGFTLASIDFTSMSIVILAKSII